MNLITTYGSFIISILLSFCRLSFLVVYFLCVKILSIPDNGLRNVDIIFQHSSINREWGGGGEEALADYPGICQRGWIYKEATLGFGRRRLLIFELFLGLHRKR